MLIGLTQLVVKLEFVEDMRYRMQDIKCLDEEISCISRCDDHQVHNQLIKADI